MKTKTAPRRRIEKVSSWAAFRGLRTKGDYPARWKGRLETELIARKDLRQSKHHAALPYAEVGAFMDDLRKREGVAARALESSILTAARSGEVRGATWAEIDLEAKVWTIDGSRMKVGKEHRVARCDEGNSLVIVGTAKTGGLPENAMSNVLGGMDLGEFTQHGFRSTFRNWAGETTAHRAK